MAAAHNLEMGEDVNRNRDREMKEMLEEETVREDRAGKDPFKPKKVHRIVSKWMLPEPVQRTYLDRANCLPPLCSSSPSASLRISCQLHL